ncbi:MAG: hypothetical protein WA672_13705 [Candidatus Angelobacter sp.]
MTFSSYRYLHRDRKFTGRFIAQENKHLAWQELYSWFCEFCVLVLLDWIFVGGAKAAGCITIAAWF